MTVEKALEKAQWGTGRAGLCCADSWGQLRKAASAVSSPEPVTNRRNQVIGGVAGRLVANGVCVCWFDVVWPLDGINCSMVGINFSLYGAITSFIKD